MVLGKMALGKMPPPSPEECLREYCPPESFPQAIVPPWNIVPQKIIL